MNRESRYTVIKTTDAFRYLTTTERLILAALEEKVQAHRTHDGRGDLECVVVESDWPEYEPTWAAISKRVDAEQTEREQAD